MGLLDTGIADESAASGRKGRIVLTLWRRKSESRRDRCARLGYRLTIWAELSADVRTIR